MDDISDFAAEFFAEEKPPRDRSGRPLLVPRTHQTGLCSTCADQGCDDGHRVAYTRASGLGDLLEEFSFLWKWKMRGLAKGLADSMDLIRLVAAEDYTCGFAEDEPANRAAGRNIDQVIERAMDRAGVDAKADYGTAIHLRTEPDNDGTDPDEKQRLDQASCWDLWGELGVVHLGTEIFTANDELRSAGTFDNLSYVPGLGIVITDKKTSSKAKSTYDIQLASYARSDVYDKDSDERMTLEEYVATQGWNPGLLNRDIGIIWWVKNGRTQARHLDLVKGYRAAKAAAWIRDERRTMGVAKDWTKRLAAITSEERDALLSSIGRAATLEELMVLWNSPTNQAIWTNQHTAAARARKESL